MKKQETQKALLIYNFILYFVLLFFSWFAIAETAMFSSATKQKLDFVSAAAAVVFSIWITEKKSREQKQRGGLQ